MRRPYVLINVAATADGKIDTRDRRGAAISSDDDRARVDQLRASVDGVMVGGNTLSREDPRLVVRSAELRAARLARGEPENPAKIGVASHLDLDPSSRFLSVGPARIILFTTSCADDGWLRERGVEVYAAGSARVDLNCALEKLAKLGIRRVLVEGGGTLNFELLRLGLVDEVQVYIAPLIFGGSSAPTLADGAGLSRSEAIELQRVCVDAQPGGGVVLRYMVKQV